MRENVSIVFASIIAVFLLIVMPLFSIMSRQDSIAYNKVLTLTTEFVDSVRTKGYITAKEYYQYMTDLAMTNNTYKVNLECHENILIKDLENPEAFVEDTLVYYNADIIKKLTANENKDPEEVIYSFKLNDEFYVKLYNTNITTASLLYNYFSGVRIAPKVINIAYGGKVSETVRGEYIKTNFDSSYSPTIKFTTEVVNLNNESLITSYNEQILGNTIVRKYGTFDLSKQENRTLSVGFEMKNFSKIDNINLKDFSNNAANITEKIKNSVKLSGNVDNYTVSIKEYNYAEEKITGIIEISNISLGNTLERTASNIVISEGLGEGSTGITSLEARTYDFILINKILEPRINITLKSAGSGQNPTTFQVELNDVIEGIKEDDIELFYANTDKIIDKNQYSIAVSETVYTKKYNVSITLHQSIYDQAVFDKWSDDIKIRVHAKSKDMMVSGGEGRIIDIAGEYVHQFTGDTTYNISIAQLSGNSKDEYDLPSYKYFDKSYQPYFLWNGKVIYCKVSIDKIAGFFDADEARLKELASEYINKMELKMQIRSRYINLRYTY